MNKNRKLVLLASIFLIVGLFFAYVDRTLVLKENRRLDQKQDVQDQLIAVPIPVNIFLGNIELNPNVIDCSKTFAVSREVKTKETIKETIKILLEGPSKSEKGEGYYTGLQNVKLNTLSEDNGTVFVDFDSLPNGGSCLVTQARAQIEDTIKQFEGIKKVVISVNNQSEGILEP